MLPHRSPITSIQLIGYGVAFGGVCWYNYLKYTVRAWGWLEPPPWFDATEQASALAVLTLTLNVALQAMNAPKATSQADKGEKEALLKSENSPNSLKP